MNTQQCSNLRDLLFAHRIGTEENAPRAFRYLAVLPAEKGGRNAHGKVATVHYAYAPPVWERGEETKDPETVLRELIATSEFRDQVDDISLQHHAYLRDGWPIPWQMTAKEDVNNFPTLILIERDDKSVAGVLMWDPHLVNGRVRIASRCVEKQEVEELLTRLQAMEADEPYMGFYKGGNLEAVDLETAIANTPETSRGQKMVMIYRDDEWWYGLWNNPAIHQDSTGICSLHSVADFHGTMVSEAKQKRRSGLEQARVQQPIVGDYAILDQAARALEAHHETEGEDLEAHPAVKVLCDWWNANAPAGMDKAGLFRIYIWDETKRVFMPGDEEEPVMMGDNIAKAKSFTLFEAEGRPTVAAIFMRGREYNRAIPGDSTEVFLASGDLFMDIGIPVGEVDEVFYSVRGMKQLLLSELKSQGITMN